METDKKFLPEQIQASDPSENIWVQANAGTGKTTVLVHRLLRILFRDGQYKQSKASGILCLTYTNAAAGEMRNRILDSLRQWAMADDETLRELLDGVSESYPVSDVDLVSCDGFKNLRDISKLNLCRALIPSSVCKQLKIPYNKYELKCQ